MTRMWSTVGLLLALAVPRCGALDLVGRTRSVRAACGRRDFVAWSTGGLLTTTTTTTAPAWALAEGPVAAGAAPVRRVEERASMASVPSWTLLIPLADLRESLDALTSVDDFDFLRDRLRKLCRGSIVSAKNFYLGVGTKYASSIKFDDLDAQLVRRDLDARLTAVVGCGSAIEAARRAVESRNNAFATADARDALKKACGSLDAFLDRCPPSDLARARLALDHFRAADVDRDGTLTDAEFYANLDADEQLASTWGVWGTAIFSDLRLDPQQKYPNLKLETYPQVSNDMRGKIAMSEF